jgi:hypothetical protein
MVGVISVLADELRGSIEGIVAIINSVEVMLRK